MKLNLLRKLFPQSIVEAAQVGSESAVYRYLRINQTQNARDSAFLTAIKSRHQNIARVLFKYGANIDARDSDGYSALHYACTGSTPQYSVVQWLVENGANVNASNNLGFTPNTGHTPLHEVSSTYDCHIARFLLSAGANPNALSPDGSPLHRACICGGKYTEETFEVRGGNIISLLLEHGADPNLPDECEASTPLHVIARSWYMKDRFLAIANLLLAYGADPTIKDKEEKTALDYAEKYKNLQIAKVFRQTMSRKSKTIPSQSVLLEKAQDAPGLMHILMDVIRTKFEQHYPQVLLLPRWGAFPLAGTVAGCSGLAIRLHYDVPGEHRTSLELAMREMLQKRFPLAEQMYEECYRFLTDSLVKIPREQRGKQYFVLLGFWLFAIVADGYKIEKEEWVVGHIAETLQNETKGYWKHPFAPLET